MRLGPFELRRILAADSKLPSPPKQLGSSGSINVSGFLQQTEYRSDLRGLSALLVFDKMLRSDGAVQEAIEHLYAPIKNANWHIEPASDDPAHLEHAALVNAAYFEHLDQPWLETLDAQLDHLVYGHSVFEIVWQVVEEELGYDDPQSGDRITIPSRQFVSLAEFAPRLPLTLYKWNSERGKLLSIVQRTFVDAAQGYQEIEIPAERLLVFINRRRGDEWTGRSILRAAYKHWVMKEIVEKQEVAALERWGVQIPVIYPSDQSRNDEVMMGRYENILANLRGGEFTYVLMPEPKKTGTQDGCLIELLSPSGSWPNFSEAINRHRGDIKAAMLARFAELGHAAVGARATGDIQSVVWFAALRAVARYICDVHQQAIEQLVDFNYPGVSEYPTMTVSDIDVPRFAEWAAGVAQLVSSGAIIPDNSFRAAVRVEADFPDEDEDTQQQQGTGPSQQQIEPLHQPGDPNPTQPQNPQEQQPSEA